MRELSEIPIALHGCQAWTIAEEDFKRVEAFEMNVIVKLLENNQKIQSENKKYGHISVWEQQHTFVTSKSKQNSENKRERGRPFRNLEGGNNRGAGFLWYAADGDDL